MINACTSHLKELISYLHNYIRYLTNMSVWWSIEKQRTSVISMQVLTLPWAGKQPKFDDDCKMIHRYSYFWMHYGCRHIVCYFYEIAASDKTVIERDSQSSKRINRCIPALKLSFRLIYHCNCEEKATFACKYSLKFWKSNNWVL